MTFDRDFDYKEDLLEGIDEGSIGISVVLYACLKRMTQQQVFEMMKDNDIMTSVEMAACYDDSMDGDHESALASAGFGTDEDYGYYGDE